MTDDIVTRLREEVIGLADAWYHLSFEIDMSELCREAADEIERLRMQLAKEREYSKKLFDEINDELFGSGL